MVKENALNFFPAQSIVNALIMESKMRMGPVSQIQVWIFHIIFMSILFMNHFCLEIDATLPETEEDCRLWTFFLNGEELSQETCLRIVHDQNARRSFEIMITWCMDCEFMKIMEIENESGLWNSLFQIF